MEISVGQHVGGVGEDKHFVSIHRTNFQDPEEYVAEVTDEELRDELLAALRTQAITFHTEREFRELLGLLLEAGRTAYGVQKIDPLVRVKRTSMGRLTDVDVEHGDGSGVSLLPTTGVSFHQSATGDPGTLTLTISGHRVKFVEEDSDGLD